MRLAWYAGASTALAGSVVVSAFHQRANFYSAMVYLFQSNLCLMILVNLCILVYSSFVYALQRICFGQLRAVEVEQLYEKAWFAVTETCLAMTIFRDEIGGFFVVMFVALLTGKVWGWIGEGRVEALEQQPPVNPRLFHTRLIVSLFLSLAYDIWLLRYTARTVYFQARADMMVMFLFEFAVLFFTSLHTAARYVIVLLDTSIIKKQTQQRLQERRQQVREEREEILRRRADGEPDDGEPLPDEEDIDEMDIEVPGWEAKGQYVLGLDLVIDLVKLIIYAVFFVVLLNFFGLPLHIIRDLFMTVRSFIKRLGALMKYRQAIRDMNKYADATEEELSRENTCIICREDMHVWDPNDPSNIERTRPKKLPCGHILHLGCLKSWMERQQVCPTCRRSVVINDNAQGRNGDAVMFRLGLNLRGNGGGAAGGVNGAQDQGNAQVDGAAAGPAGADANNNNGQPPAGGNNPPAGVRMLNFGPFHLGFAQGGVQDIQDMAQRLGVPAGVVAGFPGANRANAANGANGAAGGAAAPNAAPVEGQAAPAGVAAGFPPIIDPGLVNLAAAGTGATPSYSSPEAILADLQAIERRIERETVALQQAGVEAQSLRMMVLELQQLRQAQRNTALASTTQYEQTFPTPVPPESGPSTSDATASSSSQPQHLQSPPQTSQTTHTTIQYQFVNGQPQVISQTHVPGQSTFVTPGVPGAQQQTPFAPYAQPFNMAAPVANFDGDSSAGIPAGSSDLPPGVQIPEGWTLIPLHPVDTGAAYPEAQNVSAPSETAAATPATPDASASGAADAATHAPIVEGETSAGKTTESSSSQGSVTTPPEVPAGASVSSAPNWGGSPQASSSGADSQEPQQQTGGHA